MEEEILTLREAAEFLRADPQTVARWAKSRGLPAFKLGRQWRIRKSDLVKWTADRNLQRARTS